MSLGGIAGCRLVLLWDHLASFEGSVRPRPTFTQANTTDIGFGQA